MRSWPNSAKPTAWLAPLLCTFDTERELNCPTSAKAAKAQGNNLALGSLACSCCLTWILSTKHWQLRAVACVRKRMFRNMVWFLAESKAYSFLSLLKYHSNSCQHRCCRHPTSWPGDNGHCSHLSGAPDRRHHVDYCCRLGTVSKTKLLRFPWWQLC